MKEEQLIFIISQPRSGSTYLQNLLSNNAEVNTCSEPWLLLNFANQLKPSLINASFDNKLATKAFQRYIDKHPKLNLNEKQKEFILSLYEPLKEGFQLVIDKTPRYWEILNEIQHLFPMSKIILLKRNPIDVVKSMIITWNIESLSKLSANYSRDLLYAPGVIHSFSYKNKATKNVYVLRYEDLKEEPEMKIKDLYKWLEIEYKNDVLDFTKNEKYKGEFGDPYQNSNENYEKIKKASELKKINKTQNNFLKGYAHYLGKEFLEEYGNYEFSEEKKTLEFSYFIHKVGNRSSEKKIKDVVKLLLKDIYFRVKRIK